jgi:Predicted membrane protein (DUF2306)
MTRRTRRVLSTTGLIALTVVPVTAGIFRIVQLASGGPATPANARFFHSPVPVVLHIIAASLFLIVGALQFLPALRRRSWHRRAGRVLLPCGLLAAGAGLWMTIFYPKPPSDGALLTAFRLVFGTAMLLCLVLGFTTVRRRDFTAHRAWMMRGYAIGMGAGTQVLTTLPWVVAFGQPGVFPRAMLLLAGWLINLALAEWLIRRRPRRGRSATPARPTLVPARSS